MWPDYYNPCLFSSKIFNSPGLGTSVQAVGYDGLGEQSGVKSEDRLRRFADVLPLGRLGHSSGRHPNLQADPVCRYARGFRC